MACSSSSSSISLFDEINQEYLKNQNILEDTEEEIDVEKEEEEDIIDFDKLNSDQRYAHHLATKEGKSIFICGDAGTGKSFLTKCIIKTLEERWGSYSDQCLAITGSTGIAALNIQGSTFHGWARLGLMNEPLKVLLRKSKSLFHFKKVKTIIIDEISMLPGETFEKFDALAKHVRNSKAPFGGIQVIVIGDFYQLPPINAKYCFQTECWKEGIQEICFLKDVLRQSDQKFIGMLQEVKNGKMSAATIQAFKERVVSKIEDIPPNENQILPTMLYTHRNDVSAENEKKLKELKTPLFTFQAKMVSNDSDEGKKALDLLKKNCLAPQTLNLKVGAQVVLLANIDVEMGMANGSRGVVHSLEKNNIKVKFMNGMVQKIPMKRWDRTTKKGNTVLASYYQYPLALAYAFTIHKSQGLEFDYMVTDISKAFADGQAYVALSRARSLEGLYILKFVPSKITTSQTVIDFYQSNQETFSTKKELFFKKMAECSSSSSSSSSSLPAKKRSSSSSFQSVKKQKC